MRFHWQRLHRLFEGEGAGAGAGSFFDRRATPEGASFQAPAPGPAANGGGDPPAGSPPAPAGDPSPPPSPGEKLFAGKYKTPEDLEQGYKELSGRFSTKTDALKEQLRQEVEQSWKTERGAPEDPQKYAYPEGFQAPGADIDEGLRKWAHENGVSQAAFETLIKDVHGQTVANHEAEFAKLGTKEQATTRIDTVNRWVGANVPDAHFAQVEKIMTTAEGVAFMEAVIEGKKPSSVMPDLGDTRQADPELTRAGIRAMQESKEYQSGDPDMQRKVSEAWKKFAQLPKDRQR